MISDVNKYNTYIDDKNKMINFMFLIIKFRWTKAKKWCIIFISDSDILILLVK